MTNLAQSRPDAAEYGPPFDRYVALISEGDIVTVLAKQADEVASLLGGITEAAATTLHPPYAWTLKQVLGHVTDCERIFAYRALRFARNDATPLVGFDENSYATNVDFNAWPLRELVTEFQHLRQSHVWFFRHLDEEAWLRAGIANATRLSVRALAYVIAGHARHHLVIIQERLSRR